MNDIEVDDTTLRLERLIAAPPELVFGLWTEPATLVSWWAPEGYLPPLTPSTPGPAAAGAPVFVAPTTPC